MVSVVAMTPRRRLAETCVVADEANLFDARLVAFVDAVDHVRVAIRQVDDARRDAREAAALAAIDFEDVLNVRIHRGLIVGTPSLRLENRLDCRLLDPLVALDHNAIDDRPL